MPERQHVYANMAGMWSYQGDLAEPEHSEVRNLLAECLNQLGAELEQREISPLAVFPFADFSFVAALTSESILFLVSAAQTTRRAICRDFRSMVPAPNLDAVRAACERELGWTSSIGITLPATAVNRSPDERKPAVVAAASQLADSIEAQVRRQARQVVLRPIPLFPTGPFERDDKLCFVLMPFKDTFREVYEDAIRPTVEAAALECRRADDIMQPGSIISQIWESLMQARLVIADLTDTNGNVLYELGMAHIIGHQAILLTQNMDHVPFDLRPQRHIIYSTTGRGLEKLRRDLGAMIQGALSQG